MFTVYESLGGDSMIKRAEFDSADAARTAAFQYAADNRGTRYFARISATELLGYRADLTTGRMRKSRVPGTQVRRVFRAVSRANGSFGVFGNRRRWVVFSAQAVLTLAREHHAAVKWIGVPADFVPPSED